MEILNYLIGKNILDQDLIIDRFNQLMYRLTCDEGAHAKIKSSKYIPTQYTAQALVFMLFDLLLWADGIIRIYKQIKV